MSSVPVTNNKRNVKIGMQKIVQLLDKNRSLFLILSGFLQIFTKVHGYDNNAVAMVNYKISSQI